MALAQGAACGFEGVGGGLPASGTREVRPGSTTTYRLTASSAVGDAAQSVTVTVSSISRVALDNATVQPGGRTTLTPSVTVGVGAPSREMEWTVEGGDVNGTVSPQRGTSATYTAPSRPGRYVVWAASTWDPSKKVSTTT